MKRVDPAAIDIRTHVRIRLPFGIVGLHSESLEVGGSHGVCGVTLNVWYAPPSALGPHLEHCELESTDDLWVNAFVVRGNRHEAPKRKMVSLEPDRWGRSWRHEATLEFRQPILPPPRLQNPDAASEHILVLCCEYLNRILDAMAFALDSDPQPHVIPRDFWAVEVEYVRGDRVVGRWLATGLHIFWWRGPRHLDQNDRGKVLSALAVGANMPLPQLLLVAAKRKLAHADYRGTIIEAASAAEVALTQQTRAKLAVGLGESAAEGLLRAYQTLGGRLKLARIVGVVLPPGDLEKNLVSPRNAIAHSGAFVTKEQADTALATASAIVASIAAPAPSYEPSPVKAARDR